LKQGLELLLDCPWSTASAEQQHASATLMKKYHKEYSTESLRLRSLGHTLRLLLPSLTPEEKQRQKAHTTLARLESKRPQHFGGRQLYFKELMREAASWKENKRKALPENVRDLVMKGHGSRWASMPVKMRKTFEAQAAMERSDMESQLSDAKEHTRASMAVVSMRIAAKAAERPPLLLSVCSVSEQDEATWSVLLRSNAFSDRSVAALRQATKVAPALPSLAQQAALDAMAGPDVCLVRDKPTWLAQMCSNRASFAGTALVFESLDGLRFFRFLFAMQRPHMAMFTLLREEEQYLPCVSVTPDNWEDLHLASYQHRFTVDFQTSCFAEDLPSMAVGDYRVVTELVHLQGVTMASDSDLMPLADFLARLPRPPPSAAQSHSSKPKDGLSKAAQQNMVVKHPWLQDYMDGKAKRGPNKDSTKEELEPQQEQDEEESEEDVGEEMSDMRVEAVFEELRRKREQWHLQEDIKRSDFRVTLLGGAWLQKTKGRAFEAFRGQACIGAPEEWASMHMLTKSARFDVELHGEVVAATLAEAWCHRMQYLFSLHTEAEAERYVYTESDFANYQEPQGFLALAPTLQGKAFQRALQIRAIRPM
jgi:hypothetical protein